MITQTRFVIAVADLARSGAFYRDLLGFDIREIGDDGFRFFESGACTIFAGACPDAPPAHAIGDHSYFAYFVVDDVDAYHARAIAHGAEIVKALADEPWDMREFGLRTVDGHRIMLATPRR